jgi:hypothetical protein
MSAYATGMYNIASKYPLQTFDLLLEYLFSVKRRVMGNFGFKYAGDFVAPPQKGVSKVGNGPLSGRKLL